MLFSGNMLSFVQRVIHNLGRGLIHQGSFLDLKIMQEADAFTINNDEFEEVLKGLNDPHKQLQEEF